jgi:hypothetical protein
MEMARRFRAIVCGSGECTHMRNINIPCKYFRKTFYSCIAAGSEKWLL